MKTGRGPGAVELGPRRTRPGRRTAGTRPGEESRYRYCTECMISGQALAPAEIREEIQTLGDSVVVAGGEAESCACTYIPTDPTSCSPWPTSTGEVSGEKADDMHVQFAVLNDPMCRSAATAERTSRRTCSGTCELPRRLFASIWARRGYLDGLGLPPEWLWRAMEDEGENAQTATPPPATSSGQWDSWRDIFRSPSGSPSPAR